MSVLPPNFGSTTFSPQITSYDALAQRIRYQLGEPLIDVELSDAMVYSTIDRAIEFFTKFAGTTEEYLIFRSDLYIKGVGLPIDRLFTITPEMYNSTSTVVANLSGGWDFDLNQYRKVVDVFSYEQGNNSGVNTLFTIENTIAQQAYFGHLLGNVGYDLVTWHMLKNWIDLREKTLGLKPYLRFYPETQILKIIPEPTTQNQYFGLIGCKVLQPIKYFVSQLWVGRYALALAKQQVCHVRGKYSGSSLFGGQTVSYDWLWGSGTEEQKTLEDELMNKFVDTPPMPWFLG
jgi:hypothetical protein